MLKSRSSQLGTRFVCLALLLACGSEELRAQDIDWTRMQRDLEIMEAVLDKLLVEKPFYAPQTKSRGLYFEDYGVLFEVNYDRFSFLMLKSGKLRVPKPDAEVEIWFKPGQQGDGKQDKPEKESSKHEKLQEKLQKIKDQLAEFLGYYADAIGQLRDEDRITVIVSFGGDRALDNLVFSGQLEREERPTLLQASVTKRDVVAFRRGQISEAEFRNRIRFQDKDADAVAQKSIDIMAEIMDTALSEEHHPRFGAEGRTRGLYLKGLGAVFFMHADFSSKQVQAVLKKLRQQVVVDVKDDSDATRQEARAAFDEFKNALLEVVASYGHTLRSVESDEAIVVAVDLDLPGLLREVDVDRFVLRLKKRDVEAYNRNQMSLAQLRERAEFLEY